MDGKIYIVDDEIMVVELLDDILVEDGYDITSFTDAREAYLQCFSDPPDLLILDMNMPVLDGVSFCRRLREDERFSYLPVIFVTGNLDIDNRILCFEAGAADYITKPIIEADVKARVKTHIRLKQHMDRTISFNAALEEGIRERTEELQRAKEEAERANQSKSHFLSNINHELRTPLNGILGMLDLVKKNGLPDEELEMNIDFIDYSARHLSRIIFDILDYTQLENDSLSFRYKLFSVSRLLGMMKDRFEPLCREKGLILNIDLPTEDVRFSGDEDRIQQIMSNLISNAVKYSERGKISVHVSPDDDLSITVADQGIGIPLEKADEIFEPYVRLRQPRDGDIRGLGLGLAITRNIVRHMGGEIEAQSLEKGTAFSVRIPAHKENIPVDTESPSLETAVDSLRILIAEDDAVSLFFMEQVLEDDGHEVTTVINGRDALNELKESDFDVALMDIGLPGMSGLDVIRSLETEHDTVFIAVTAFCRDQDIRTLLENGFQSVLCKPVGADDLLKSIEAARSVALDR